MADVELRSHDPDWRDAFERERERIRDAAADGLLRVFHVGSTAVPGLLAKPNVDVLAVYETPEAVHDAKRSLLGDYERHRDDEAWVVLTRTGDDPGVVVHLRPRDAQAWRDQVVFREFLRDDADARATYEDEKRAAAEAHPNDVSAYTDAKEPVIESLLDRADAEGYDERLPDLGGGVAGDGG